MRELVAARIGGAFGILANQIFSEVRRKTPPSLSAYEALLTFYHYNMSINPDSFHSTLAIVKATLEQEPEYGNLWSALAALYADNYVVGFCPEEAFPLEDAENYARKGAELAPDNQATHMASGVYLFSPGRSGAVRRKAQYAYQPQSEQCLLYRCVWVF